MLELFPVGTNAKWHGLPDTSEIGRFVAKVENPNDLKNLANADPSATSPM
jgi:hypothetical protein